MTFFDEALPYAQQAHAATGLFTSLILAQWADETAFGGPDWSVHHNPGNVGSFDGQPVASFPTLSEGVAAYIQLMNKAPQFAPTIRRGPTAAAQAFLLGNAHPVWASSGYRLPGGEPGSALISIITTNDLSRFDAAPPPPPVPHPPTQEDDVLIICNPAAGQNTWLIGLSPTHPPWKLQIPTPEDVNAWRFFGAKEDNSITVTQIALIPTVAA